MICHGGPGSGWPRRSQGMLPPSRPGLTSTRYYWANNLDERRLGMAISGASAGRVAARGGTTARHGAAPDGAHPVMQPVGQHIRVPKTAELVAAQLRRQIIKGELREGESLAPESILMEQFGVSRPTLREAFRVL